MAGTGGGASPVLALQRGWGGGGFSHAEGSGWGKKCFDVVLGEVAVTIGCTVPEVLITCYTYIPHVKSLRQSIPKLSSFCHFTTPQSYCSTPGHYPSL